jgi:hypothetical protein
MKQAEGPTVTLNGTAYTVPELVPRQLCHVRRALLDFQKAVNKAPSFDVFSESLTDEHYAALVEFAYWGVANANDVSREEFDKWKIGGGELFVAFFAVRNQSGLFVKADTAQNGGAPGEATAETTDQNQTGTTS